MVHTVLKVGVVVTLFLVGSLAVGLAPSLTKSGRILGGVAERLSIDSVYPVIGGTYTDVPLSQEQIVQTGGEHFEWSFIIHVGERAEAKVVVRNQGGGAAMAELNCTVPAGLGFAVLAGQLLAPSQTARFGQNAYVAEIRAGATKDFRVIYKGLTEGDYQASCTISDLGGVGGPLIDQNTIATNVPVGIGPFGVAYDTANKDVYVTNMFSDSVSVIDGSSNAVTTTIPTGAGLFPAGVAYDSKNGRLFVADAFSNTLTVIDGSINSVIATISSGAFNVPLGVAFDSSNGEVYVTNAGSNTVTVVDGSTYAVGPSITVGTDPEGIAYDSIHDTVYVANFDFGFGSTVSVISGSTNTVVATTTVGLGPIGAAFDVSSGNVLVTDQGPKTLSVIDGSDALVIATFSLSATPYGVAFDSGDGNVYAGITTPPSISVKDDSTGKSVASVSLPVLSVPYGIAFDPTNGDVYVANFGQNSVTVIETV